MRGGAEMAIPKLRFKAEDGSEFPEWETDIIENCCHISTGKSNTQDRDDNGKYDFYVRSQIVEKSNKYLYDEEAVLTAGDGVGTGKVYHYVNGKYDLHQRVYRMSNFKRVIGKYFYYYFSTHFYKRVRSMSAKNSVDSVRMEMIAKMPLMIPSLPEQKKIADFLSTIDSIISSQKEELTAWEQGKKGIMQKLFSQEVRFKAEDGSEFPEWVEKRLKDICCKIGSGKTPKGGQEIYQDCGVMLIRSQNVRNGFLDLTDVAYISNEVNQTMLGSTLKFNDLLLNITGASIGRCCKYNTTQQGNVNQHVCVLRIENQENTLPDFALSYLLSDLIQNQIDLEQSGGSREGLNFQQVGNLKIKLPSLPEQKKIADCLSSIDEVIKKEKEELEKWQELKKGLLQQMFV